MTHCVTKKIIGTDQCSYRLGRGGGGKGGVGRGGWEGGWEGGVGRGGGKEDFRGSLSFRGNRGGVSRRTQSIKGGL